MKNAELLKLLPLEVINDEEITPNARLILGNLIYLDSLRKKNTNNYDMFIVHSKEYVTIRVSNHPRH